MRMRRLLCQAIAYSYDAEHDAFIINGRPCSITLKDVDHITGLPCKGKNHVSSNQNDTLELWKELKDPNDKNVTLKGLLAKMKGDITPNFFRRFVLYTICKYVCPTTQQYVDNRYLGIVRNTETIKSTNFGQLTLDHLMASIRKFVNSVANLEGNIPLLQCVDDLPWPFNPPPVGTSVKLKTDGQDEEGRAVVVASKESLKNVLQLYKELDASQGAPSLDSRKHSKATTILEAFLDPLILRHNKNVRKAKETRNQDDEDFSIEVLDVVIEIMRPDHPKDIRDVQLLYIEKVASVAMLERDGKVEKCHEAALVGSH
ncbi:epstein-barr virus ebna-1-like protein [Hordeum vulgare]|nr:epstein-barr virus ebna-1-like protein [Hordeum vulgare]